MNPISVLLLSWALGVFSMYGAVCRTHAKPAAHRLGLWDAIDVGVKKEDD